MFCHVLPSDGSDGSHLYAVLRYETIHHRIRFRPFWARDFVWYMIPNCLQLTLLVGHAQARVQNHSPRKCLSARSLFAEVQLAKPCVEVVSASWDHSPLFFNAQKNSFLRACPSCWSIRNGFSSLPQIFCLTSPQVSPAARLTHLPQPGARLPCPRGHRRPRRPWRHN